MSQSGTAPPPARALRRSGSQAVSWHQSSSAACARQACGGLGQRRGGFFQVGHPLDVLDQGRQARFGRLLHLRAHLAHLGQRVREHLAQGVFQRARVDRHAHVGQRGGRQQEAAHIHVIRADAPVEGRVAFALFARGLRGDHFAHRGQRLLVGLEEQAQRVLVQPRRGWPSSSGGM